MQVNRYAHNYGFTCFCGIRGFNWSLSPITRGADPDPAQRTTGTARHPQLDWGSMHPWIPVATGMTGQQRPVVTLAQTLILHNTRTAR